MLRWKKKNFDAGALAQLGGAWFLEGYRNAMVKLMICLWCHTQMMFWTILLFLTKTFQNMLVFQILKEGFMMNQHLKNITKHKI